MGGFVMPKGRARSCVLSALASWLVLLASADDFNLTRFMFPPAESESEDLLPLDDPNCDFTRPSETWKPNNSGRGGQGNPATSWYRLAGMKRTPPPPSGAPGQLAHPRLNTPLLC
jgi:hypothetical protein